LTRICKRFEQIPAFRSVKLVIDIDPIWSGQQSKTTFKTTLESPLWRKSIQKGWNKQTKVIISLPNLEIWIITKLFSF
jgi:hypothetical protein